VRRTIVSMSALILASVTALTIGAAGPVRAATVGFDAFDRPDGLLGVADSGQPWQVYGQQCGGCTAAFFVDGGHARIDPASRVPTVGLAVIDTNLTSNYRVEADITMSSTYQRANTGLTALFRDPNNHLFCKIEVTAGNPEGLLTIGETQAGRITSLLSRKRAVGLSNGTTYHLMIDVPADPRTSPVQCTVSEADGAPIAAVSYRLNSRDWNAYGSGDEQGLRTKVEYDEDDAGSSWDHFQVTSNDGSSGLSTTSTDPGTTTDPTTTDPTTTTSDPSTTTDPTTTTMDPTTTTTTTTAPVIGCRLSRPAANTAVLSWVDTGGTHVIRRNDTWLATPGTGTDSYTDTASPETASYVIRTWVGGSSSDTACN
jgi:hypothetical protein